MTCKECDLWVQREIPKVARVKKKKEFYPAGRCCSTMFNNVRQSMFTVGDTNCRFGVKK